MADLKKVHQRIKDKQKKRREINKMFRDELTHNAEYKEISEQLKALREKKKSIENEVRASAGGDVVEYDTLGLELKADSELLADIALNMYVSHQTVEIEDEDGDRWEPVFTVKFKKAEGSTVKAEAEAERAASHPERTFVPDGVPA